jgi:hypothetical protein
MQAEITMPLVLQVSNNNASKQDNQSKFYNPHFRVELTNLKPLCEQFRMIEIPLHENLRRELRQPFYPIPLFMLYNYLEDFDFGALVKQRPKESTFIGTIVCCFSICPNTNLKPLREQFWMIEIPLHENLSRELRQPFYPIPLFMLYNYLEDFDFGALVKQPKESTFIGTIVCCFSICPKQMH